jgi:hypothetical protein
MKRPITIILGIFIFPMLSYAGSEMVTSKATPKEVYEKVAEAANYLARYGEGGVKELQNPDGRFVWKDTYVMVVECEVNSCFPNPKADYVGMSLKKYKCYRTKKFYVLELCNKVEANPRGAWTEYWWPKPGYDQPQRRISFMMQVPDQPYQVISSTYDDNTSLENLDKISKTATSGND